MEKIREINGIKFRMATLEDHPKLIDFFFDIYLKDEPATKSRGGYLIRPLGIVNLVQNILYQNLSIIAEDIETGDVVGINTNCLFKRYVRTFFMVISDNTYIFIIILRMIIYYIL